MGNTRKFGILVVLLGVLFLGSVGFWRSGELGAQTGRDQETQATLEKKIAAFFNELSSSGGSAKTALDELLRDVPLRNSAEAVDGLSAKYAELKAAEIGTLREFELIDSKWVGKDLILMRYLFKHDNYPVLWYFTFYRAPRPTTAVGSTTMSSTTPPWGVVAVRFDTNLEPLSLKGE